MIAWNLLADSTFAGLTVLQIALVSLALLIIMMNVLSGWNNGVVRQVLRIGAMLGGYVVGYYVGPALAPLVPFDQVLGAAKITIVSILSGLLAYWILRIIINTLFRKTSEQESRITRLIYGIGGGAVGLFFSIFFLIIFVTGIRLLGTVADAQIRVANKYHQKPSKDAHGTLITQFSKARQAIETGPVAPLVETIDPLPESLYTTLDKIASVTSDRDAMGRFMSYPGTRELMEQPSLKKLAEDPKIQEMAGKKDFIGMARDPKVILMFQDEALRERLKNFEFKKALEYSLTRTPAPAGYPSSDGSPQMPVRKAEPIPPTY